MRCHGGEQSIAKFKEPGRIWCGWSIITGVEHNFKISNWRGEQGARSREGLFGSSSKLSFYSESNGHY